MGADPRASEQGLTRYTQLLANGDHRKRSERPFPNDLASLGSKFGQLKRDKPSSGAGPQVLATWVSKFPRSRR